MFRKVLAWVCFVACVIGFLSCLITPTVGNVNENMIIMMTMFLVGIGSTLYVIATPISRN